MFGVEKTIIRHNARIFMYGSFTFSISQHELCGIENYSLVLYWDDIMEKIKRVLIFPLLPYHMHRLFRSLPRTVFTARNLNVSSQRFYSQTPNRPPQSQDTSEEERQKSSPNALFVDKLSNASVRMTGYLREMSGSSGITIRKRAGDLTASTEALFSHLGSQLNRATGYEDIEALKRSVVEQEARINAARETSSKTKKAYEDAVIRRSQSQREVNELLQRKSNWTDGDVSRFTTLVREDHLFEQSETKAKEAVAESDAMVDRELNELLRLILTRYHEEQVWSDKIRSASTYGSMAALGLNLIVFIVATLVVEPWKRRRLAQTFEHKVEELSVQTREMVLSEMQQVNERLEGQERMFEGWQDNQLTSVSAISFPVPAAEVDEGPQSWTLLESLARIIGPQHGQTAVVLGAVVLGWTLGQVTRR